MFGLPLAFAYPWVLLALISLPVIWWLLRLTPPRPQEETFPPTRILARLGEKEETPAQSPWWLTLLRLLMAALVIIAMAGPTVNPEETGIAGEGPVLIVMDDGWASAINWEARRTTALGIIEEAERAGRPVMLESSTARNGWDGRAMAAGDARPLVQAAEAVPLLPDHQGLRDRLENLAATAQVGEIHWLSDGLARPQSEALVAAMKTVSGNLVIYNATEGDLIAIADIKNEPSEMTGTVTRADPQSSGAFEVTAHDGNGVIISRASITYLPGEKEAEFVFDQPVELRNQIEKLAISGNATTASVRLLDENNRRRLVGLISGETFDQAQPLLSPLYYISRALEPYSDLRRSDDANVAAAIPDLINQGVSVIILADVGTLPEDAGERLGEWVEKGGMLIRFAGPRLGASPDGDLLPVDIRPGDRNLGGALSWETPKPLAAFDRDSPFYGLEPPRDVLVRKQLLALQETGLDEKTWSRLEDGTPLVTADQRDAGWIVLYHVGSDAEWSNLPLSGTFVEMLRRTVNLSSSSASRAEGSETVMPPLRMLDATGAFVPPNEEAEPITVVAGVLPPVSAANPPGFYGTEDGIRALNLFAEKPELNRIETSGLLGGFISRAYSAGNEIAAKSWLLAAAAALLILDCLAVLWMAGGFRGPMQRLRPRSTTAALMVAALAAGGTIATVLPAPAQQATDESLDYSAALETRLAYVRTGIAEIDDISEAGMRGLTRFITTRTALEPGEPVGLDVSRDELSFYSLIYWPVDPRAELPDPATMARVDAFMKQGGSVLFDTRDQIAGVLGGTSQSPAAQALQQMLSSLDIPSLEPVPYDHVLTKAFYLLDQFPGRFNGGDLWVETTQLADGLEGRPARAGDGVSSILITSNDFAGAWAVDNSFRPLLPTVPPDPVQRNYAFRAGVNLMMYALTGNYKADQVHLPALLERLGQ